MILSKITPLVINGWNVFAHPLFLDQIEALITKVDDLYKKDPINYTKKNIIKRLAAINQLAFIEIPEDPSAQKYRLGKTLGDEHKYWFRAKFFQQYRLFFRYHIESKIIIYAWVNDENSKRAYEHKSDAYRRFQKMLKSNHPPDDWEALIKACKNETSCLSKLAKQLR